jgi:hypothetical protein
MAKATEQKRKIISRLKDKQSFFILILIMTQTLFRLWKLGLEMVAAGFLRTESFRTDVSLRETIDLDFQ